MSANDKFAATFGPGRTTPTPTLETRIAEVLAQHMDGKRTFAGIPTDHAHLVHVRCACGWQENSVPLSETFTLPDVWRAHVAEASAAALAPVIREQEAEASAQAFQAVRDNAEYEQEERDGPNLIIAAYLMIDVDKLNALDKSHDGMDWVRYTATDYANALRKAEAEAWAAGVATALNHAILNEDGITLRLEHLDGRPWANPYRSNDDHR